MKKGAPRRALSEVLPQIPAETLDPRAGFFQRAGRGGVGNPERGPDTERRTLHHRNTFRFEQLGDEILIVCELFAVRRGLADCTGAGWIDVKRAFRLRALDAAR